MKPFRGPKTASVIEHELNRLLLRDFEFEGALVTLTSVEVSSDLGQAKVRLGIIPEEKGPEVLVMLEKRRKELEHKLLKKTRLRTVPRLKFEIDNP